MENAISLQPVEDQELTDTERLMFNMLKATLLYPANVQAQAKKLAEDIAFFNEATEIGTSFWEIWAVFLDIASCVPTGHLWQESLLQCLENLRQRKGRGEGGRDPDDDDELANLPDFSSCVREKWNSDPTELEEDSSEEFAKWKNLNSFIARFMSTQPVIWLHLPIWLLRNALEEPASGDSQPAKECRLWVVSEWLIRCASPILKEMRSAEELEEAERRSLGPGELCHSKPLSIERWEFWKGRLIELAAGVDTAVAGHISDALQSMKTAETHAV